MRATQNERPRRPTRAAQRAAQHAAACFPHLPRILLGAIMILGLLALTAPAAHADDCAFLTDCFATVSTAAQVIAGVAVVVAATALALPSILRATRGPSEVTEAGVNTEAHAQGPGQAQGQGQSQTQRAPSQQQQAQPVGATGGNQGLNLPNLPDTPDLPLSPELSGMLGTGAAGESDARSAREYSPQALEEMRTLGLSPADVEQVIQTGTSAVGSEPGTTVYTSPQTGVSAVVDAMTGRVLSVGRG